MNSPTSPSQSPQTIQIENRNLFFADWHALCISLGQVEWKTPLDRPKQGSPVILVASNPSQPG